MKSLLRLSIFLAVFFFAFSTAVSSALALSDFLTLPTASFQSIDPYGANPKDFTVGERNVVLSRLYIDSRNALVKLKHIKFENLGTVEPGDIRNMALYINGSRVSSPQSLSSNIVTYLTTPYSIRVGFPITVELRGDIADGAGKTVAFDPVIADNIQLVDENNADNVRLYKSELSMEIVLDRILGSGSLGSATEPESSGFGSGQATEPNNSGQATEPNNSGQATEPNNSGQATESESSGFDSGQATESESSGFDSGQAEVITENPFPDTNLEKLEGMAAASLQKKGIITGYPDGEFKGSRKVNRVEALKILLEAKLGDVEPQTFHGNFSDIDMGEWYVRYLAKALDLEIINGYPDGTFRPGNPVNTVEFLKMMNRTFDMEENLPYTYGDVETSDWFAQFVGAAQKYEMFPDRPHFLVPAAELTRNEMAVAIYQYLKNKE